MRAEFALTGSRPWPCLTLEGLFTRLRRSWAEGLSVVCPAEPSYVHRRGQHVRPSKPEKQRLRSTTSSGAGGRQDPTVRLRCSGKEGAGLPRPLTASPALASFPNSSHESGLLLSGARVYQQMELQHGCERLDWGECFRIYQTPGCVCPTTCGESCWVVVDTCWIIQLLQDFMVSERIVILFRGVCHRVSCLNAARYAIKVLIHEL